MPFGEPFGFLILKEVWFLADKDELKELEDLFNADDPEDLEGFLDMLDSIDVDDNPLAKEMDAADISQLEEKLGGSSDSAMLDEDNPFGMDEDFYKLTEDEEIESVKKIDGMLSELGLAEPEEPEEPAKPQKEETAFVSPDDDIMNLLDSVSEEDTPIELKDVEDELADEGVGELADILAGIQEEEEPEEPKTSEVAEPKKGFFQKLIEKFHKQPTEEELRQRAQEEEEERAWEEREEEAAKAKKAETDEKKKAKKAEAEQKKKEKDEQKEAQKAAKQKQVEAKKAEKAAKKAEKEAQKGPIPKSQLVPVKPLLVFIILGIAFCVVFVVFTNYRYYNATIADSKEHFIHQKYKEAYEMLLGLELKKKDQKFYEQVRTVRMVDKNLDAYNNFVRVEDYEMALESLIKGIGRYGEQSKKAEELNLEKEMRGIYEELLKELTVRFGMTAQDAVNLYNSNDKETYQKQIWQKATEAAVRDGIMEPAETEEEKQ